MPMNIHTVLNESGGTISGGQQQRILIARAIYNDPDILFFDEATSALDNITQAKVCASLDRLKITRVVIAHRLSTVRSCDRIIVINQGEIIESGNFDELMAKKGQFYEMASRQLV
jgi:ABC-type bacteriocin/lantibiotic exporter with double-glycine peptidase domain